MEDNASFFERLQPSLVSATASCMRDLECSVFLSETGVEDCFSEAETSIEPTPAVVTFCETTAPRFFECGLAANIQRCIEQMKGWSDSYLLRGAACSEEGCDGYRACIDTVFEVEGS